MHPVFSSEKHKLPSETEDAVSSWSGGGCDNLASKIFLSLARSCKPSLSMELCAGEIDTSLNKLFHGYHISKTKEANSTLLSSPWMIITYLVNPLVILKCMYVKNIDMIDQSSKNRSIYFLSHYIRLLAESSSMCFFLS